MAKRVGSPLLVSVSATLSAPIVKKLAAKLGPKYPKGVKNE